jgi:hypothetical protein
MNTLWTFGCSFTNGMGCNPGDEYYEKHKKEGDKIWPALVAEHLNMELQNISINGCRNDVILDNIIDNYGKINEGDLVIIGFTISQRFDVPYKNNFISVIEGSKKEVIDFYTQEQIESIINFQYYFANSDLYKQRQLKRFNFIINLLKERGVKVCFWKLLKETENKFNRIQKQTKNKIRDGHFSYDGHKEFFTYIKSKLEPKDKFI